MPIGSNFDDFLKEQGEFELCTAAAKKSALKTVLFDAADYLDDEATIAVYLSSAKADSNPAVHTQAVIDIARAREAIRLAKTAATSAP
jgi:DNA-binding phage protein